jgi:hypothetical protein
LYELLYPYKVMIFFTYYRFYVKAFTMWWQIMKRIGTVYF